MILYHKFLSNFIRFKELKMYSVVREILFYLLFLYLMMMVAYGNRDPWSLYMYQNHKNMFQHGSYSAGYPDAIAFDSVSVIKCYQ